MAGCGCIGQQHLIEIVVLLCYPEKREGAVQHNAKTSVLGGKGEGSCGSEEERGGGMLGAEGAKAGRSARVWDSSTW